MRPILGITLCVFLNLTATSSVAQHPDHVWSQRFGNTSTDVGTAVAVDGSGNVVVTGSFSGTVNFGGENLISAGGADIFVTKYSASGVHQWSKRFGSSDPDQGLAVAVDNSGNAVVTGFFNGTVSFGGENLFSGFAEAIFVAKYDANGVHQWSDSFGSGTGNNRGQAVAMDNSGAVVVTGWFTGSLTFGGAGLVAAGNDIFVAKFSDSGVHQWSQRFGSSGQDIGFGVAVDGFGNVVVTGFFNDQVTFGDEEFLFSAGAEDIFVVKFDASGTHLWSHGFGNTGNDLARGVAVDGAGNVLVTGRFTGSVNFGGGTLVSVGDDIFVAKFNGSGTHQWSQRFANGTGNGVAVDGSGSVLLTGLFSGTMNFGGHGLISAGGSDSFLAKFDENGVHQWSEDFGNPNEDEGRGVAVDGNGNVIMTGRFRNTVDFGGGGLVSAGSDDIVLAKYGSTATGVNSTPATCSLSISAYPNPFNPHTTVRYDVPTNGRVTVEVFDTRGALVVTLVDREMQSGSYSITWNGRDDRGHATRSGVYFVRLKSRAGVESHKLTLLK